MYRIIKAVLTHLSIVCKPLYTNFIGPNAVRMIIDWQMIDRDVSNDLTVYTEGPRNQLCITLVNQNLFTQIIKEMQITAAGE